MTDDFGLPPGLQSIERELAARPYGEPSTQLREKCLGGLRTELRRQQTGNRWAFAAVVAAILLVGLNFSISASQSTDFGFRRREPRESVQQTADEIQRLLPELPPREALRQAVLLRAGTGLVRCPTVSTGQVVFDRNLERAKPDL